MFLAHHDKCGKPAFYMTRKPAFAVMMRADIVRRFDGRQPEAGSEVRCGSCGEWIVNMRSAAVAEIQ